MSYTTQSLGTLKRIDARTIWKHEALHFTPWLRDHLDLLADALGLELELPETEVAVGEFSCDVVATDTSTRQQVVIENQLAQTDHGHLGQAITYAAGLGASTVVWISPEFREPHRQALDWLNANTTEGLYFFAVEVELLQIDNSAPAVHFKVVAQPNNWQKIIKATTTTQVSEKGLLYQQFWSEFRAAYSAKYPPHSNAKHTPTDNWITVSSAGRTGFTYYAAFTKDSRLKVELSIEVGNAPTNKLIFDDFAKHRAKIDASVGVPLSWERLDHAKSSRIAAYRDAQVTDTGMTRQAHIDWATEILGKMRSALTPHLTTLKIDALAPAAGTGQDGLGMSDPTDDQ